MHYGPTCPNFRLFINNTVSRSPPLTLGNYSVRRAIFIPNVHRKYAFSRPPTVLAYYAGPQHFIICSIPDSELPRSDAALRLVKKNVQSAATPYEPCILQRLAVTDSHAVTAYRAHPHLQIRTYPMYL